MVYTGGRYVSREYDDIGPNDVPIVPSRNITVPVMRLDNMFRFKFKNAPRQLQPDQQFGLFDDFDRVRTVFVAIRLGKHSVCVSGDRCVAQMDQGESPRSRPYQAG